MKINQNVKLSENNNCNSLHVSTDSPLPLSWFPFRVFITSISCFENSHIRYKDTRQDNNVKAYHQRMATVRCFLALLVIVFTTFLSWAVVIMIDFYAGHGKSLTPHKLSDKPPFPGAKMENLFWIVQVYEPTEYQWLVNEIYWMSLTSRTDFRFRFY